MEELESRQHSESRHHHSHSHHRHHSRNQQHSQSQSSHRHHQSVEEDEDDEDDDDDHEDEEEASESSKVISSEGPGSTRFILRTGSRVVAASSAQPTGANTASEQVANEDSLGGLDDDLGDEDDTMDGTFLSTNAVSVIRTAMGCK